MAGLRAPAGEIGKLDAASKFTGGNGEDGVVVFASTLNNPAESVWPAFTDESVYRVKRDGSYNVIEIRSGLKIQEGATLLFDPETGLSIREDGYLTAIGTAAKRIKFTGAVQTEASWLGILFFAGNPLNELNYTDITHGGSGPVSDIWFNRKANVALVFNSTKLKLTNSTISNSGGYGVAAEEGAGLTESGNIFSNNALDNIKTSF